jgi:predicted TIM-barrel fold metal-dependent hydrolase
VWAPHLYPYAATRNHTPPAAPIEHYLAVARVLGLERGVMVQPNAHGTDTRITLDAVRKSEGRVRGMIRADPSLTPAEVERLHDGGVRGLRIALRKVDGHSFDAALFQRMVDLITPHRWPLDLQIDGDAIESMSERIRAVPVPVIIDTFGHMNLRSGLEQPAIRAMVALLETGKVWVKTTGANRFLALGVPYATIVTLARRYITVAPDRILWGTDWPHSAVYEPCQMPNDGDLLDMLLDYAPDEAQRRKILVDNPAALFDIA